MSTLHLNSFNLRLFSLVLIMGIFGLCLDAHSQKKKERTRLKLYFSKLPDGNKKITAGLLVGKGKDMRGLPDAEIRFTASANDSTIELTSMITNEEGQAVFYIEPEFKFPVNEEGKTLIEATYKGSKEFRKASNDVEIGDLVFEIKFETEDSINFMYVFAKQVMPDGEKVPVEELSINIGVNRMLSVLPLEEIETDEDGMASFEFPADIPGDSVGLVTVVARIEDTDDFGTVEQRADINWGTPVSYELQPISRQLWTDEAPLWMIISVFIVLAGAWYHFFLSVYKLRKIRNYKESNA